MSLPPLASLKVSGLNDMPRVSRRSSVSSPLTHREIDVLRLIAVGMTDRQIAATLGISRKTASNHVANLLHKLEVPTRAAAVTRVISERLLPTRPTTGSFRGPASCPLCTASTWVSEPGGRNEEYAL